MIKPTPAFYKLVHLPTGLFYGGSTAKAIDRINWHRYSLLNDRRVSKRFQEAFTRWEDVEVRIYYATSLEEAMAFESDFLRYNLGHTNACNIKSSLAPIDGFRRFHDLVPEVYKGWLPPSKTEPGNAKRGRRSLKSQNDPVVEIDGVKYNSVLSASIVIGVSTRTIERRLGHPSFSNYKRL